MTDRETLLEAFDAIGIEYYERKTGMGHAEIITRGDGFQSYHAFEFDKEGKLYSHGSYDD